MMRKYCFKNLLGASYSGGNILFSSEKDILFSAIGNRIHFQNVIFGDHHVFSTEVNFDIIWVLPAKDNITYCIDASNRLYMINTQKNTIIHSVVLFKSEITAVTISPDFHYGCAAADNEIGLWKLPCAESSWLFELIWKLRGHEKKCTCIKFIKDDYILSCGYDMQVKVWSVHKWQVPLSFLDCKQELLFCYQSECGKYIVTGGKAGYICIWKWYEESEHLNHAKDVRPSKFRKQNKEKLLQQQESYYLTVEKELSGIKNTSEHFDNEGTLTISNEQTSRDTMDDYPEKFESVLLKDVNSTSNKQDIWNTGKWVFHVRAFVNLDSMNVSTAIANSQTHTLYYASTNGRILIARIDFKSDSFFEEDLQSRPETIIEVAKTDKISNHCHITHLCINPTSTLVAYASNINYEIGIWQWQSDTILFHEKNLNDTSSCLAVLPSAYNKVKLASETFLSSHIVATGNTEGTVRLWDANQGHIIKSFSNHSARISGLLFTLQRNLLISSSYDGTLCFYDLYKKKCFRQTKPIYYNNEVCLLKGLVVDYGCEILAAYCNGRRSCVYIIDIQTGKTLDEFGLTDTSVNFIAFSPHLANHGHLAIACNNGSIIIWDVFGRENKGGKPIILAATTRPALTLTFNPSSDGANEIIVSHVGATLYHWNYVDETIISEIEGVRDIYVGRESDQEFTANNDKFKEKNQDSTIKYNKGYDPTLCFHFIDITLDGRYVVAANKKSPKICIYDLKEKGLASSFYLSKNRSVDNLMRKLNSKKLLEGVPLCEYNLDDSNLGTEELLTKHALERNKLAGIDSGKHASISNKLQLYTLVLSSNSSYLYVGTKNALYIFAKIESVSENTILAYQNSHYFLNKPETSLLSTSFSQADYEKLIKEKNYSEALQVALAFNNVKYIETCLRNIDETDILTLVINLSTHELVKLLHFFANNLENNYMSFRSATRLYYSWLENIFLCINSSQDKELYKECKEALLSVLDICINMRSFVSNIAEYNEHVLAFLAMRTEL